MLAIAVEKGECDEEDPLTTNQYTDRPEEEVDGSEGCTCDRAGIGKCALATLLTMLVIASLVLIPYMAVGSMEASSHFDAVSWVGLMIFADICFVSLCVIAVGAWLVAWKMVSRWRLKRRV